MPVIIEEVTAEAIKPVAPVKQNQPPTEQPGDTKVDLRAVQMFAIEELSRSPEQRSSGLIVSAIVLAGLVAVSVYGNGTYFGVIHVLGIGAALVWPGLLTALVSGVAGGLFARQLRRERAA